MRKLGWKGQTIGGNLKALLMICKMVAFKEFDSLQTFENYEITKITKITVVLKFRTSKEDNFEKKCEKTTLYATHHTQRRDTSC